MSIEDGIGYNFPNRLVYCPKCKTDETSDKPVPKCSKCLSTMLTVVYNALTGERLTGQTMSFPEMKK